MSNSTFIEEERPKGFWQERYEELREKYDQLLKSKDAPDKIYVPSRFNLVDGLRVRESDSDVEYLRKDTLLEWAKEERAKCFDETHPYAQFMNVVIDKLNSM